MIVVSKEIKKNDDFFQSSQSASDESQHTGNRRRGEILETALLQAAWDELADVGYTHLTMEGVAARAGTNKAVLYRRWSNKSKLIVVALHKYMPKPNIDVPDTGDLRTDVFTYLQGIAKPLQTIGGQTIHGLMVEFLSKEIISSMPQILHPGTESKLTTAMITILKRAGQREEVNFEKISSRIITLPFDLFRYELITTHEPVSDQTINEIVDDIFMPLVREYTIIPKSK